MISFILTVKRLLKGLLIAIKDREFLSLLSTLLLINLSGVLFYRQLEGWSYLDSIYFSWVSLIPSSINIGFSPITSLGKIFTMIYLVIGVGVMIGLLGVMAKVIINYDKEESIIKEQIMKRKKEKKLKKKH